MDWLRRSLLLVVILSLLGLFGGWLFVYLGIYNISALKQHTTPVYSLLKYALSRSVAVRSDASVPELAGLNWQGEGLRLYMRHCQQCHGAPGVGPEPFSLGMVPAPTAIVALARERRADEIFWVVKHGIKMTGMPAWDYRLTEEQMWNLVAFVKQTPNLTAEAFRRLRDQANQTRHNGSFVQPRQWDNEAPESQIAEGRVALQQYNCVSCHVIPGVTAGRNHVGPPLGGITQRAFIAGVLEYNEENFVRWVRFPQEVDPKTMMPNLGVTQAHAEAMLAYLRSLEPER